MLHPTRTILTALVAFLGCGSVVSAAGQNNVALLNYMYEVSASEHLPITAGSTGAVLADCQGKPVTGRISSDLADAAVGSGRAFIGGRHYVHSNCPGAPSTGETSYGGFREVKGVPWMFGYGSRGNVLYPFVSVRLARGEYGAVYQVKELRGMRLPTGEIHNGCVRIDDTCPECSAADGMMNLAVGTETVAAKMSAGKPEKVTMQRVAAHECSLLLYNAKTDVFSATAGTRLIN